jgi:ADP-ribosylation factor GTPase-activating protein 2/3
MGRTASPFLNAVANGTATRPKSPLVGGSGTPSTAATGQAVPAAAVRKTTTIGAAARKPNILGAKKKTGLGAKKIDIDLDFDAAEKKAKEEAQRIEKLGYDPNGEAAEEETSGPAKFASSTIGEIASPTPISPRAEFGATQGTERGADVEKVGTGMARLGFGQVGGKAGASAPKKMGGFGSTSRPQTGKSLKSVLTFVLADSCI